MARADSLAAITALQSADRFYIEQGVGSRRATLTDLCALGGVQYLGAFANAGAVSNIDIPLPAGFRKLRLIGHTTHGTGNGNPWLRLSNDGGATFRSSGGYEYAGHASRGTASTGDVLYQGALAGADSNAFSPFPTNNANALQWWAVDFTAYDQAGVQTMVEWYYRAQTSATPGGDFRATWGSGRYTTAEAHDYLRILRSASDYVNHSFKLLGYI